MRNVICPNCGTTVEIPRCELCAHLNLNDRCSIEYKCTCPHKVYSRPLAAYKVKGQPACQYYVADINRITNKNTGDVVKNESTHTNR